MARIRSIHPEFWTSEQVVELPIVARLLFIGLWTFCDDRGVHPASSKTLKMEVFPGDDITAGDVSEMVELLIAAGLLKQFCVDGKEFWFVTGWRKYQKTDRPSIKHPAPPTFDEPSTSIRRAFDEPSTSPRRALDEPSTSPRRALDEPSTTESIGEYSKGEESKGEGVNARAQEGEEKTQKPPEPAQDNPPTAYEVVTGAIFDWSDGYRCQRLREIATRAKFEGDLSGQITRFITHHLAGKNRERIIHNPVQFLLEQLPGWLLLPAAHNKPRKNSESTAPSYSRPPTPSGEFLQTEERALQIIKKVCPEQAHQFTPDHIAAIRRKSSYSSAAEITRIIAANLQPNAPPPPSNARPLTQEETKSLNQILHN